jgi:hypothetical protein
VNDEKQFLTAQQVAVLLQLNVKTICRWAKGSKPRTRKFGYALYFPADQFKS